MTRKQQITDDAAIRVDVYVVVSEAVEAGVRRGLRHYWKHRENAPSEDVLLEQADEVADYVMSELSSVLTWPDGHAS